jgi:hypothetical protein
MAGAGRHLLAAPGRRLPLVDEVGESVHAVGRREDAVEVAESVVHGEGDELAAALERSAQ